MFSRPVFFTLLTACSTPSGLDTYADRYALRYTQINEGGFTLATLSSAPPGTVKNLHVYIGGDGHPWKKNLPAENPTGSGTLAQDLMRRDPHPAIYLTRPCYHLTAMPAECEPRLWTTARYSEQLVEIMSNAVRALLDQHQPKQLTLIGYSGGGVVALLVAERLQMDATVLTIAANLDTDAWTDFHKLLPLSDSLNPRDSPSTEAGTRRLHLLGGRDQVVPPATLSAYRSAHPEAEYYLFEDFDHKCCWREHWTKILAQFKIGAPAP